MAESGKSANFINAMKKARKFYGLTQEVMGALIGFHQASYSALEKGRRTVTFELIDIAEKAFGIEENKLTAKRFTPPPIDQLPVATRNIILENRKVGKEPRNGSLKLRPEVEKIISNFKETEEFSRSTIYELLPEEKRKACSPQRVSDTLNNKKVKSLIMPTGRKTNNKEVIYRKRKRPQKI